MKLNEHFITEQLTRPSPEVDHSTGKITIFY